MARYLLDSVIVIDHFNGVEATFSDSRFSKELLRVSLSRRTRTTNRPRFFRTESGPKERLRLSFSLLAPQIKYHLASCSTETEL